MTPSVVARTLTGYSAYDAPPPLQEAFCRGDSNREQLAKDAEGKQFADQKQLMDDRNTLLIGAGARAGPPPGPIPDAELNSAIVSRASGFLTPYWRVDDGRRIITAAMVIYQRRQRRCRRSR